MALPSTFYATTQLREPWRTPLIAGGYALTAVAMVAPHGIWVLALICIGGAAVWLWRGKYAILRAMAAPTQLTIGLL